MRHSFQARVLISILAPVVTFCIVTNMVISTLLGYQLMEKREEVEKGYLSVIYSYLEDAKDNMDILALIAENSSSVKWAMRSSGLDTTETKKYALAAQSSLSDSLSGSPVNDYVDSMALVNRQGMYICVSAASGIEYAEQIFSSPLFKEDISNGVPRAEIAESVLEKGKKKLVYLYPLNKEKSSYIYMELSTDLITVFLVVGAGIAVSRIISKRVTQPLQRLSAHINRLTEEKVLTEDRSIEAGEDEISKIGKEFNRLVRHINSLIKKQKKMYEQRQRLEMNALQAQINPHFLYNTLDSVRWMAVIQNAGSIADTVMSLENLLRNMAKGVGDKITLREELSLVQDYVHLQQVRYMEIFDYICDVPEKYEDYLIVKMTMQPIIENAIFHGIEPTGDYGVIKVHVRETERDLYISIEDNGMGMDENELADILKSNKNKNKNALSGVGIVNVDERLKMTYGSGYGLIYEGKKGEFTRVTIHIPKEKRE